MFRQKQKTGIVIPQGVDWSRRSSPYIKADAEGYRGLAQVRRADQIARENVAYLRDKARQSGSVVGYHGTTTPNAISILRDGFQNRLNEEGRYGVSAWDEVAVLRAIEFAHRRSNEAGEPDVGMVLRVEMLGPEPDKWHGRLEWLADARQITAVEAFTPDELVRRLGGVAAEHVHYPAAS